MKTTIGRANIWLHLRSVPGAHPAKIEAALCWALRFLLENWPAYPSFATGGGVPRRHSGRDPISKPHDKEPHRGRAGLSDYQARHP